MKKFLNDVDNFLHESLSGFAEAHKDIVHVSLDPFYVTRKNINPNKVLLVSGGGSGHEPLHTGYIGQGMLDIACPGHIFTSPTPDQMIAAIEYSQPKNGVLFIVKNYSGDVMNFEMAAEMISSEHKTILINDDAAVINSSYTEGRRGVAGTVIVEKVVGSLAEDEGDLESCHRLGEKVNHNCSSIGVALTSCTIPAAGKTTFDISESDIEFGVGIHGEPGRKREKIRDANSIVKDMLEVIYKDFEDKNLPLNASSEVLVLVNGFNSTPLSELYLLYNAAHKFMNNKKIKIARSLVGNYTTALDMAGASITICLLDDEIKKHWDASVLTPNLRWGV
jgi:dihydroxyacetone kinase-like protein